MKFKIGDIVCGNKKHLNSNRQLDKGVVAKIGETCLWVVWFEKGYEVQSAYQQELKLLWRDPEGYLE